MNQDYKRIYRYNKKRNNMVKTINHNLKTLRINRSNGQNYLTIKNRRFDLGNGITMLQDKQFIENFITTLINDLTIDLNKIKEVKTQ